MSHVSCIIMSHVSCVGWFERINEMYEWDVSLGCINLMYHWHACGHSDLSRGNTECNTPKGVLWHSKVYYMKCVMWDVSCEMNAVWCVACEIYHAWCMRAGYLMWHSWYIILDVSERDTSCDILHVSSMHDVSCMRGGYMWYIICDMLYVICDMYERGIDYVTVLMYERAIDELTFSMYHL